MKRKDFLKRVLFSAGALSAFGVACDNGQDSSSVGNLGIAAPFASSGSCGNTATTDSSLACVLIPTETKGPYPLDLSSNSAYFRADVTEGKTGISLILDLTILNVNDSCNPITNARVDIWHCDKDGYYSGYSGQSGYLGTKNYSGETFCRGIQLTDVDGKVSFTTIYPGWYPGRVTHIHFQIYLNNGLVATSQIAFPEDITETVYNTTLYKAHGQNTVVPANCNDGILGNSADDLAKELCTITENATTGGYIAALTVGVAV